MDHDDVDVGLDSLLRANWESNGLGWDGVFGVWRFSCSSVCLHNCWNSGKVRNHVAALSGRAFLVCFSLYYYFFSSLFFLSFNIFLTFILCALLAATLLGVICPMTTVAGVLGKQGQAQNFPKTKYKRRYAESLTENKQLVREGPLPFVSGDMRTFSHHTSGLTSALTLNVHVNANPFAGPITHPLYKLSMNIA